MITHTSDKDCHRHLVDGYCTVCGVTHVEPCDECEGRGYHNAGCSAHEDTAEQCGHCGDLLGPCGSESATYVKGVPHCGACATSLSE